MQIHDIGVVSSNPINVTIEKPFVGKTTGNRLTKSTFLENNSRALSLVYALLEIKYGAQHFMRNLHQLEKTLKALFLDSATHEIEHATLAVCSIQL